MAFAAAALALGARASAQPPTQQALLPGPTPYPTQSPPLMTGGAPPRIFLPFAIKATTAQRVTVGVDERGGVVSLHARQRIVLVGTGDYQIAVGAPVEDVRAGLGSESQPGLRTGQILWAGFSPGRKVLVADATLRPGAAAPFLPLRVRLLQEGDGYSLTVTNTTQVAEIAYAGTVLPHEIARFLDQTRRESLAGAQLSSAYATFVGLVRVRDRKARIEAPFRVEGVLRFPGRPTSARGGRLNGATVSFARTLGDGEPLSFRVDVQGGGGAPRLSLVARPAPVARLLRPPGAPTWQAAIRRRPIAGQLLLERLIDTRMRLVRADQYEAFLSNPDTNGRNRTVYVYETTAAPRVIPAAPRRDSGGSALIVTLVVVGSVAAAGAAVVLWAHS